MRGLGSLLMTYDKRQPYQRESWDRHPEKLIPIRYTDMSNQRQEVWIPKKMWQTVVEEMILADMVKPLGKGNYNG